MTSRAVHCGVSSLAEAFHQRLIRGGREDEPSIADDVFHVERAGVRTSTRCEVAAGTRASVFSVRQFVLGKTTNVVGPVFAPPSAIRTAPSRTLLVFFDGELAGIEERDRAVLKRSESAASKRAPALLLIEALT